MAEKENRSVEALINEAKELADSTYSKLVKKSYRDMEAVDSSLGNIPEIYSKLGLLSKEDKTSNIQKIKAIGVKTRETEELIFKRCYAVIEDNLKLIDKATKNPVGIKNERAEISLENANRARGYIDRLGEKYKKLAEYGTIDTKLDIAINKFGHAYGSKKKA